jgi:hypothetical protein
MAEMNYAQTQQETVQMKERFLKRREEIALEKERLDRENGEIERQLIGLERVLEGLEFLSSDVPPEIEEPGFTEQIRRTLQRTRVPLTALEIRDTLLEEGIQYSSPKTLLISVHTVLGRLMSDLQESKKDGKPAYTWKHTRGHRHVFPSAKSRSGTGQAAPRSIYGLLPPARE